MRRLLLLLALATMLLVITAVAAHADYWPPDAPSLGSLQGQLSAQAHQLSH
jgi:hypothetical protein